MNPPEASAREIPPVGGVGTPATKAARFAPIWFSCGLLALIVGVHWAVRWQIPFPQCLLRKFTGIPCPTCGCTRSLLAWSDFDLAGAFRFNPLFFVLCLGLLAWVGLWCVERLVGRRWLGRWSTLLRSGPAWKVFIALAVLNWLYLCLRLPK